METLYTAFQNSLACPAINSKKHVINIYIWWFRISWERPADILQAETHDEVPTHLDFLINLRDTFLRVDIEDERPQGLNVAVVDRTPAVLEVGGEQLQDPGQSGFYKAAFALRMGEVRRRLINLKSCRNSWKVWIKGLLGNQTHQTSPLYECVGYGAPTPQLIIHLKKK